jgi:hypothetical protein
MQGALLARTIALALVAISSAILLAWAPPFVSLCIAVTAAICWCLWLERHPVGAAGGGGEGRSGRAASWGPGAFNPT